MLAGHCRLKKLLFYSSFQKYIEKLEKKQDKGRGEKNKSSDESKEPAPIKIQ